MTAARLTDSLGTDEPVFGSALAERCGVGEWGGGVFKDSHTGQRPQEEKQPAVTFRKPGLKEQQLRVAGGLRGNRGLNKRRRGSEGAE